MRVLAACEESQRVCKAFRQRGHEAYSCDIIPCSGGHPEWHMQRDVTEVLSDCWDLIIAFPPCTDLSCACANLWPQKEQDGRQKKAFEFVKKIWNAPCEKIVIENPQGWLNTNWISPTQTIHPYYFGDPYFKRTCLWIKGLQPLHYCLKDTQLLNLMGVYSTAVEPIGYYVSSSNRKTGNLKNGIHRSPKDRSKISKAIAKAMADQWGGVRK